MVVYQCFGAVKAFLTRCLVAGRRKLFGTVFKRISSHAQLPLCAEGQAANDLIRSMIEGDKPFLITRFGSYELEALSRGIDVQNRASVLKKIGRMLIGEGVALAERLYICVAQHNCCLGSKVADGMLGRIIEIISITNIGFDHLIPTRCKISPLLNVVVTGEY